MKTNLHPASNITVSPSYEIYRQAFERALDRAFRVAGLEAFQKCSCLMKNNR